MAYKINDLTPLGRNLASTDQLEVSLSGATGSRKITGAQITAGLQPTLVSGTSIKTINSTSILGSGNVAVQPTLVSGTNIKSINGNSLLGSGNVNIPLPRTRNYFTPPAGYASNIVNLEGARNYGLMELELLISSAPYGDTVQIYRSYSPSGATAGSIFDISWYYSSSFISFKFKRTFFFTYSNGTGEEGYYWEKWQMTNVGGYTRTDEDTNQPFVTQDIYFNDSNGTTNYPNYMNFRISNYMGNVKLCKIDLGL